MEKKCLSESEFAHLQIFINDPIMREALRKILTYEIYFAGTVNPDLPIENKNFAFSLVRDATGQDRTDEEIGKRLRATIEAAGLLESALSKLDLLKEIKETQKDSKNPAR